MTSAAAWWLACRPKTLWAAVVPVAVGAGVAAHEGGFVLWPVLAALGASLLIQIGTNFANDVYDYEKGADTADRVGPLRAVAAGLISPATMKRAMIAAFGAAALLGLLLVFRGGWPILVIGVASILSGILYTAGPYPLAYLGLGDVFVFVFFGFVAVCGTVWLQLGAVPPLALWASIPVASLSTAVLVVNNLRDRKTDLVANKRTLAVRFGRRAVIAQYVVLLLMAYSVPLILVGLGFPFWILLSLLTLPLAAKPLRRVLTAEGPALNTALGETARLLLVHGGLLAALFAVV